MAAGRTLERLLSAEAGGVRLAARLRRNADGTLSLFDNHLYAAAEGHSRGMVFALDEEARTARLLQEYAYDDHLGTAMGSMQVLPGGNVLVGWGTVPAATEFTAAGDPVWEATLGGISYRAYRHEWTARPTTTPSVAARAERGGVRVFASWNGATEVRRWRVLSASDAAAEPQPTGEVAVSGFETSLLVPAAARVGVEALDASGQVLARSQVVGV